MPPDASQVQIQVLAVTGRTVDVAWIHDRLGPARDLALTACVMKTVDEVGRCLLANEPDVILLDLARPDERAFAALARLRELSPGTPLIFITGKDNDQAASRAVDLGAFGYIARDNCPSAYLRRSIRFAAARRQPQPPPLPPATMFQTFAEELPNMIFVNYNGRVVYANRLAAETIGYTREEFYDPSFDFLTLVHPQHIERVLGSFRRHKQGQEIEPYEYKLVTKSGRVMDVLLTTRLIPYEEGQAILGVITDVSQRRQAEESLRQYALEILARNEELDAFAHTVAHDVRNPLGLVIGFAEVLALEEAEKGNQELAVHLENIARNARQVDNIVEELLLLSGLRGEEVELQELDMADLVNEALGRLEIMIQNMRAEVTLPDSWPAALGHPPWVVQVWVNYLSNALKYGGRPPHVELGAELHDGVASFWIQDDGPGLTEQQQAQLFVPFTRLAKLRAQGYGLGLSIVRRIVERLGGQVAVESEGVPGLGSRFYFTLQAAPDDEETQSTASNPPEIPV